MERSLLFIGSMFGICVFSQSVHSNERIVVAIHANLDTTTAAPTWLRRLKDGFKGIGIDDAYRLLAEAESISAGHAWISVRQGVTCKTFGLFDGGPKVDQERMYAPGIQRSREISRSELSQLQDAVRQRLDYQWTGYYNCASYAAELWKEATGETINPVPTKTYYVDSKGERIEIRKNVRLKPLPPSPLGVIQEIIRLSKDGSVTDGARTVCP